MTNENLNDQKNNKVVSLSEFKNTRIKKKQEAKNGSMSDKAPISLLSLMKKNHENQERLKIERLKANISVINSQKLKTE